MVLVDVLYQVATAHPILPIYEDPDGTLMLPTERSKESY